MEKLKKYLLFLFLLENVAAQTRLMGGISTYFFYIFLVLGAMFMLQRDLWRGKTMNTYWPLYVMGGIYVLYEFTFGQSTISMQTLVYLIAKLTTFAIIVMGVDNNFKFYERKMLYGLSVFICFFVVYGMVTGGLAQSHSTRMLVGFGNANSTSGMGAFVLGAMLFITEKWNLKSLLIIGIGLYAVLAGGSRAGIMVVAILMFIKYGFSPKMALVFAAVVFVAVYILPAIGLNTVGVERFLHTVDGTEGTNRDNEREACWLMIREKPWNGWGFEAQNQGRALEMSELGSHNGYLETLKFMGYPCGGAWLGILVLSILVIFKRYHKLGIARDMFVGIVLAFAVNAYFEGLFVGVHEFATNVFFVCLAVAYKKAALYEKGYLVKENNK
ncbi:O-antigen ligase family protein [Bacteroides congonensis]|uniref:O-antigen ligase family protein n=1 Tax=Bacteroides congonensis TaxID=1871006 RepID=UPI001898B9A6|nr:O-antigen ligase family protein [Bacteroides congonensis]